MEIEINPAPEPQPEPVAGNFPEPTEQAPVEAAPETQPEVIPDIEGVEPEPSQPEIDENGNPVEPAPEPAPVEPPAPVLDPEIAHGAAEYKRLMADPVLRYQAAQREIARCQQSGEIAPQWVAQVVAMGVPSELAQQAPAQQQQQYTPQQVHQHFQAKLLEGQKAVKGLIAQGKYVEAEEVREQVMQVQFQYDGWKEEHAGRQLTAVQQRIEQQSQATLKAQEAARNAAEAEAFRKEVRETCAARNALMEWKGPGHPIVYKDKEFAAYHKKLGAGMTANMSFRESVDLAAQLAGKVRVQAAPQPKPGTPPRLVTQPVNGTAPRTAQAPPPSRGMIRIPVSAPPGHKRR